MELTVAGAGKAATAIASMLAAGGVPIKALIARSEESLRQAAALTGAENTICADITSDCAACSDALSGSILLLIAVPDDSIALAARTLCSQRDDWSGSSVVHLSGATELSTLECFRKLGARIGVFHPCIPIRRRQPSLPSEVVYTFEGDEFLGASLEEFVAAWNGTFIKLNAVNRALYHCGTLFAAGHLAALMSCAARSVQRSGVSEEDAREIMLSVARGVFTSLERGVSFEEAITGPFVRGDESVISRHNDALQKFFPEASPTYADLGELSRRLIADIKQ